MQQNPMHISLKETAKENINSIIEAGRLVLVFISQQILL